MASKKNRSLANELATALDGIAPGNEVSDRIRRNLEDPEVAEVDRKVSNTETREEQAMKIKQTSGKNTQTKAEMAQAKLDELQGGQVLQSPNGMVKVAIGDGQYRYTSGKRKSDLLDEAAVLKRLAGYKFEWIHALEIKDTEEQRQEEETELEQAREKNGLLDPRKAAANSDKRRRSKKQGERRGERKPSREGEPPEGFELIEGGRLMIGDLVVTEADLGPERIVEVGSGGKSRGKEYLKWMLVPADAGETDEIEPRRRFTSPRKVYPARKIA